MSLLEHGAAEEHCFCNAKAVRHDQAGQNFNLSILAMHERGSVTGHPHGPEAHSLDSPDLRLK
jgi:hypothetical protein